MYYLLVVFFFSIAKATNERMPTWIFLLSIFLAASTVSEGCTCIREFSTVEEVEYLLNSVGIASFRVVKTDKVINMTETQHKAPNPKDSGTPNNNNDGPNRGINGKKNGGTDLPTVDRMDIFFGFESIIVYPDVDKFVAALSPAEEAEIGDEKNKKKGIYIKFIPKSTCGIACQHTNSVTERWLVKDNKIVKRGIANPNEATKTKGEAEHNPWDLLIAHMSLENGAQDPAFGKNGTEEIGEEYARHPHRLHGSLSSGPVDLVDRGICCRDCCNEFMNDMKTRLK